MFRFLVAGPVATSICQMRPRLRRRGYRIRAQRRVTGTRPANNSWADRAREIFEGATTKGMTTVSITQKDGTMQQIDKTNFASWKRKVGKHAGFHLTPHPGEELIVCTRSEMQQLPDGNFSAILVKKCKITDSELKKELRGFEVWKAV